jgi:hypothetical protein
MESDTQTSELEVMPVVTFDVKLGDKATEIGFDYAAYAEYLRTNGASDEQIRALGLHFARGKRATMVGGYYFAARKQATVFVSDLDTAESLDQTTRHETSHALDYLLGRLTQSEKWKQTRTHVLRAASWSSAIAAVGTGTIAAVERSESLGLGALAFGAASVVAAVSRILSYANQPDERRAHDAANDPEAPGFVHFVPVESNQERVPMRTRHIRIGRQNRLAVSYGVPRKKPDETPPAE